MGVGVCVCVRVCVCVCFFISCFLKLRCECVGSSEWLVFALFKVP